ncbi:MAG: UDP-glucose/GDP-mannose dehydrogenase family protein [Candidatus Thermoplasmatota archaeon]|nr:UDP-glucose/GDP-mannose dehydrogenase family protein [Candidatus Thermoplasmatota archaeon]
MKIGIVGLGFVGLVTAAVLSVKGDEVIGVDINSNKIKMLNDGLVPIYEPKLDYYFKRGKPKFSDDFSSLNDVELSFISVPTPTKRGRIDLRYIYSATDSISQVNKEDIVIKSTVVPGTAKKISERVANNVISNPEFLREGTAISDSLHPDRIVIGGKNTELIEKIWSFTGAPIVKTTTENAELIKYASNAFLATKISFINEISNLCEKIQGAEVEVVAKGMGYDKRISPYFLKAGLGYGGSCLPKDTSALCGFASDLGVDLNIIRGAMRANSKRIGHVIEIMEKKLGSLKEKKVGILGLAFKENTNDIRESRSLLLVKELVNAGSEVRVYDPAISKVPKGVFKCKNIWDCYNDSDALIIATEWDEFRDLENVRFTKPVFDLRRLLRSRERTALWSVGTWTG